MFFEKLKSVFMSRRDRDAAQKLYSSIVGRARTPDLFSVYGVDDSLDGRFDMILLHLFLVVDRLQAIGSDEALHLAQTVQEVMIDDMDRNLREMGVGDMSVGKKVKQMGEAWFGRRTAYFQALGQEDPKAAMARAFERNVFPGASGDRAARLADYALSMRQTLSLLTLSEIGSFAANLPDPQPIEE